MPRIDPLQLLNCLNVLLTPKGGFKSEHEVARISSLMEKFSKKLVSKCVYLLILKSSEIHLLSKFMGLGGWNLIYNWLLHAVEAKNYPFLIELLEVIIMCPVDIERLKSNPMPRQIKYLSKDFTVDSRVRDLASDIVKHWLAVVKGTPAPAPLSVDNVETVVPSVVASNSSENNRASENVEEINTTEPEKNQVTESRTSSGYSGEEEEEENYVKSTSPSSSSLESDESDVFVPYKKIPIKKKTKLQKKESPPKKVNREETPKLKSKFVSIVDPKESSKTTIKLKIEKRKDEVPEPKTKKAKEKTIEEKIKEKRKLKEEKEREKFAKFIQERGKKDKYSKDKRDSGSDSKSSKEKSRDEKLKSDLSKLIPKSLEKLGRIPKISKDADKQSEEKRREDTKVEKLKSDDKKSSKKDEKSPVAKPKDAEKDKDKDVKKDKELKKPVPVVPPKKPVSMSVEVRESKPKTVKAKNSKFRLTGLEQELIPKPPSRKPVPSSNSTSASSSSVTPSSSSASSSIPSTSNLPEKSTVKRSPPKDLEIEPAEKKLKSPDVSILDDKQSPVSSKTKKPFLQESDFFMNAMNTAVETQKELRKKKKATQKVDGETKFEESPLRKNAEIASSPTLKSEKEVKPSFKFYKDTFDLTMDDETADTKPVKTEPMEVVSPKTDNAEKIKEEKDIKPEVNKIRSAVGLKSSLSILGVKKYPKKTVGWKQDDELESVQYFEVDVSERTNVVRNFWDMQMMERTKERESMLMVRKIAENDKMAEQTKWRTLIPIDVPPSSTARGVNSQEKNIQYARERMVPPTMPFQKIPDTPAEPDLEIHPVIVPPVIPLDDISGSQDSVNDFSLFKWPEPKQYPPENGDISMMNPGFVPPPMFPPFPDGTFPPPFGQPFFPGGPVGPVPVPPANWTAGNTDQNQQNTNSMPMNWPNVVPPVGPPGMMGPPPFGLIAPPFPPIPGPGFPGAPNIFPPPSMNQSTTNNTTNTDNQQFSSSNSFSSSSENGKKWSNDDRYYRKDNWKNSSNYSERSRDRRSSSSWRGSSSNSRLCRTFQKKGFCNVSGCRFYHPED